MKFKKFHPDALPPRKERYEDAGIDLATIDKVSIPAGSHAKVRTGIGFEMPVGTVGLLWPRSRFDYLCGAGVIDESYRGEVIVKVVNPYAYDMVIPANTYFVQMVLAESRAMSMNQLTFEEAEELSETDRGDKGGINGNSPL